MLRVDGSSRSSYLKDFILHGCFLRRLWTVIDFYCLFIHRSRLRLKFPDHWEFVDSVHNWLLSLERAFMACWYFEGSCWETIYSVHNCLFSIITTFVLSCWVHFCGLLGHVLCPQSCTSFSFLNLIFTLIIKMKKKTFLLLF